MSTFSCPVVRVAIVEDHFNADRLSIIKLEGLGYTCISAKLDDGSPRYKVDDWVVYIPSASVLPEWLLKEMGFWNEEAGKGTLAGADGNRVKPLKLRGVFSEGVLYPVDNDGYIKVMDDTDGEGHYTCIPICVEVGDNVAGLLGITKYEPPIPIHMAGEVANLFGSTVRYDFERLESVPDIFELGEMVVATEKLHGTMVAILWEPGLNHPEMFGTKGEIIVHSKGLGAQGLAFKNNEANANNLYVRTLNRLLAEGLEDRLREASRTHSTDHGWVDAKVCVLGEIFGGSVQDLKYGLTEPSFRVFDIWHELIGWLTPEVMARMADAMGLETVPQLYSGPFDLGALEGVRDGKTALGGANIREGIVVRSATETQHPVHGRKICKMVSPDYLTRKVKGGEATEYT